MSDPEIAPITGMDARNALPRFDADLLALIADGVLALDADAHVIMLNAAAATLLGRDPADLVGQSLWDALPSAALLADALRTAWAGQPTLPLEFSLASGQIVVARLRLSGDTLLLTLRDLTELRQAQAALRESEGRFRNLTDNISEVFWLRDAVTGETLYISPAHERIYGRSLDSAYADRWSFLDVIHPDDRHLFEGRGQTKDHPYFQAEYRIIQPDGSLRWASARTFPILNDAGEIQRLGGVIEDITERKQLDGERTRRLNQLQALARAALRINATIGMQEALNAVTEEARAIIGAHQGVTSLTVREVRRNVSATSISDKYARWADYETPPNNNGIYMIVEEENRIFRFTQAELEAHPRWRNFSGEGDKHPPMRGWLAAPIVGTDGKALGMLQLSDKYEGDFTQEDEVILGQIAQFASTALEKARLFDSERNARLIADTLQSANLAITQALELEPILELLLDYLGRLVPYDGANVMLLEDDGKFHGRAVRGYESWSISEAARHWVLDPHDIPLINRLVTTRQTVKIDDTQQSTEWYSHPDTMLVRSWLGVPLIVEDVLIGMYSLDSAKPDVFTDAHRDIAQALAAPAAFAIQRALLFDEVLSHAAELEQRVEERTHELVEANWRLEALNQAKAKFVSDVSHELRNPIASLNLSFELMKRRTSQQIIERLPDMQEQMDLLLALTNSILDISRLDLSRGVPVAFAPVDLNELLSRVVDLYRPTAENAGLKLRFLPHPDLPPVRGEQSQLTQVATNLVSNAIKYTPSGHVNVRTTFDLGTGYASLIVEDTGLGINDEDMQHLFERFYRGSAVRQSTIPGTGLGLPIVYDVVQLHGGSIGVESTPGQGSRFTVLLPLEL